MTKMMLRLWLASGALLLSGRAVAEPLTAGAASAVAFQNNGTSLLDGPHASTTSIPDVIQANAQVSPTARVAVTSDTRTPWTDRLAIDAVAGAGQTLVAGYGIAAFGANQRIDGPGGIAHISYTFHVDGSFFPGDQSRMAGGYPQRLEFSLVARPGQLLGTRTVHDGALTDFRAVSTLGEASLLTPEGSPLHVELPDNPTLAFNRVCLGVSNDNAFPCIAPSGTLDQTLSIAFDVPVGEDFWIAAALRGITDGQVNALHTAKLTSIALNPAYDLMSDDGGTLVRHADGTYAAVPEPTGWALMLAGFGTVALAVRRSRTPRHQPPLGRLAEPARQRTARSRMVTRFSPSMA